MREDRQKRSAKEKSSESAVRRGGRRPPSRASWVLLQALLGRRRRTVGLRKRHDAVRAPQVRLEGLLIGGLQRLKQMLRLPTVVTMETPVAPEGEVR